jgi:hypothetical protein
MTGTLAIDTLKSFHEIMSPEDFDEFIKGVDSEKLRAFPEVVEFMKAEKPWEKKDKEDEKEEKEEKEDPDEEKDEKKKGKKKEEEEEDEKAITPELIKGVEDRLNGKIDAVTTLLKAFLTSTESMDEIKKSVDSANEVLSKIAGMPAGTKALRSGASANFFEKSFGGETEQDDEGKKVLSVTQNKEVILKALEKGLEKAVDAELIRSYQDSIISYNGGGGMISKAAAFDLYDNYGIRLVN